MTTPSSSLLEAHELHALAEVARSEMATWWLWDEPESMGGYGPMLTFARAASPEQILALCASLDRAERLNGVLRAAFRRRMREWRERAPEYSYDEEDVEQFLLTAEREADLPTVDDITGILDV